MAEIQGKIADYLTAGAGLVWVVEPRTRTVTVYRSEREFRILREVEEIEGGTVLPGFRLRVEEIFEG